MQFVSQGRVTQSSCFQTFSVAGAAAAAAAAAARAD